MWDPLVETRARREVQDRIERAARDRRAGAVRPKRTRHTVAASLRRFADRLDS